MDKQAKAIKQAVPDAQVERVGEGINVTFNSALLFKINSSTLSDSAKTSLAKIAGVFTQYPETNLLLEGHTDDTGSDSYNMKLSEQRAEVVKDYLVSQGVAANRFTVKWYGEGQPKYPNDNEANRALNRRVELAVMANEEMKQDAQKGNIDTTGVR
jgi:outer membrane protein OmpA-like peptidoglycan-associated protein